MLNYPSIDPVAVDLGPVKIHWYGLMYLAAFLIAGGLGILRSRQPRFGWNREEVVTLITYAVFGVIVGGRVGYMLFYAPLALFENPLILFKVWQGGMSFHGGLLGVIIAMKFFARHHAKLFFEVADFAAPLVPLGYFFGRIGNFINGELWGRVTEAPWGMIFPYAGPLPRHPSQLYQAFLEGLVLFVILWVISSRHPPRSVVSAIFLILFGIFRIFDEFFREPDSQLGYLLFNWITMGQVLSLPMVVAGAYLLWHAQRNR